MPELPEVHTISQDLKNNVVGYVIEKIQISKNYKIPKEEKIKLAKLQGKKILDVDRIAKNIVVKMSEDEFLVFHLAMTGRILLRSDKEEGDKWVKVVFKLLKNGQSRYLKFADMRQFGKIRVLDTTSLALLKNKYGLSVLDDSVTPEKLLESLKSKKTNIKNALLDQSIISGLGNIYATDALFLSGINPIFPTQFLTLEMSKKLLKSSKQILEEGIKNRGSTLPDKMYVDIFGKSGSQQNYFKIYGKKICSVCNSKVEFEKINGRGTYFCPTCQPDVNENLMDKESEDKLLNNSKQKKLF